MDHLAGGDGLVRALVLGDSMNAAEIEKEAERIAFSVKYEPEMEDEAMKCFILEKLRAVHDACMKEAGKFAGDSAKEMYIEGFNDGIEKVSAWLNEQVGFHASFTASELANAVRILKLSSEAGGGE